MTTTFKILTGLAPPPVRDTTQQHPFPWEQTKIGTGFDVPHTYWTEDRGLTVEGTKAAFGKDGKIKTGYAKDRIKASFKGYQARGTAAEQKAKAKLAVAVFTVEGGVRAQVIDAKDRPPQPAHLAKGKGKKK